MVEEPEDAATTIARLEARVASLEQRLGARSRTLRALSRELCEADLINVSRAASGRAPHPGSDVTLLGFRESAELAPAEVDQTLEELWRSLLFPRANDGR